MLNPLSPLECLNANGLNTRLILENVTLNPNDTLRLYDTMNVSYKSIDDDDDDSQQQRLELNSFGPFSNKQFIARNDVQQFECELKSELLSNFDPTTDRFAHLVTQLNSSTSTCIEENKGSFDPETDLPALVEYLKSNDMLPCLAFSLDRAKCERYTRILYEYYSKKEQELRETKYKKRLDTLAEKRLADELQRKKNRDAKSKKSGSKSGADADADNDDKSAAGRDESSTTTDYSLLDNYLDECVLTETKYLSDEEVEDYLKRAFKGDDAASSQWRREALKRGFYYHHGGMNNRKRVCVESLFRAKQLPIVFCTTTLAQGIHVPCKTVVFLNNSIHLDAGTFKQCAGRAGRRGFDTHASVIFLPTIPLIKAKRLLSSRPGRIRGTYLTTPSLLLNLFNLAKNVPATLNNCVGLLTNGLYMFNSQEQRNYQLVLLRFYVVFCCKFLLANGLINHDGEPIQYAQLTLRFGYHEPGNLLLNHLVVTGEFNRMCDKLARREISKDELHLRIVKVIAHLFNPLVIRNLKRAREQRSLKSANSQVVLDTMSDEVVDAVEAYNDTIDRLFKENAVALNDALMSAAGDGEGEGRLLDTVLPLSAYAFDNDKQRAADPIEPTVDGEHFEHLLVKSVRDTIPSRVESNKIVSPFAGLSGLSDAHIHIKDKSVLVHLKPFYLDFKDLYPTVQVRQPVDFYGNEQRLNSYFVDFYKHGFYKCIIKE